MRFNSSLSRLFAAMCLLVFGVGLCVWPTVAYADLLKVSDNKYFTLYNVYSLNASNISSKVNLSNFGNTFAEGKLTSLNYATESYTYVSETGTGTFTESGSTSVNYNSNTTGTTSNSGYYNETGTTFGWYDPPDSGVQPLPGYSADNYNNGTNVENGTISTSEHGSGTGTFTGSGSATSSVTGQNQTFGSYFWEYRPDGGIDVSGWVISPTYAFLYTTFGTYPAGTVIRMTGHVGTTRYYMEDGSHSGGTMFGQTVWTYGNSGWSQCQVVDGKFVAQNQFYWILVTGRINDLPQNKKIDSLRFPFEPGCYIDLDASYQQQLIANDNANNSSTNQTITNTTQQQTNQLKDTTGANTVLDGATAAGNQIKNNVTFASQLEGVGTQLATLVASAQPSEAGFSLPSWEFQGQQIWPAMNISVWENIPVDIKSRIRLFNTIIFAILWLRSLWNWIASIFGFEQVDDSGGSFDDLFDEDEYNEYDSHSLPPEYFGPRVSRRIPGYRGRR